MNPDIIKDVREALEPFAKAAMRLRQSGLLKDEKLARDVEASFRQLQADLIANASTAYDRLSSLSGESETVPGVKALEPFAKIAEHDIGADEADTDFFQPMVRYNSAPRLTVGDLRRARTAFEAIPSEGTVKAEEALREIAGMLEAGQGDDDGPKILPDFDAADTIPAKVARCLHLLEVRRDVVEATSLEGPYSKKTVKVRALEWTNIGRCVGWTAEDERTHLYHAKSLDRLYEVARGKVGWWAKWQGAFHAQELPTIDEAKAAAQADFERRVWACLTTPVRAEIKPASAEAVAQFRKVNCSDWYDGLPDHEDGGGPYETRTLYAHPVEEPGEVDGETYYTKGKDAAHFERLNNKDFAWALTCAAQDLNDSSENVSSWMPVTALLDGAAERIKALEATPSSEIERRHWQAKVDALNAECEATLLRAETLEIALAAREEAR